MRVELVRFRADGGDEGAPTAGRRRSRPRCRRSPPRCSPRSRRRAGRRSGRPGGLCGACSITYEGSGSGRVPAPHPAEKWPRTPILTLSGPFVTRSTPAPDHSSGGPPGPSRRARRGARPGGEREHEVGHRQQDAGPEDDDGGAAGPVARATRPRPARARGAPAPAGASTTRNPTIHANRVPADGERQGRPVDQSAPTARARTNTCSPTRPTRRGPAGGGEQAAQGDAVLQRFLPGQLQQHAQQRVDDLRHEQDEQQRGSPAQPAGPLPAGDVAAPRAPAAARP